MTLGDAGLQLCTSALLQQSGARQGFDQNMTLRTAGSDS